MMTQILNDKGPQSYSPELICCGSGKDGKRRFLFMLEAGNSHFTAYGPLKPLSYWRYDETWSSKSSCSRYYCENEPNCHLEALKGSTMPLEIYRLNSSPPDCLRLLPVKDIGKVFLYHLWVQSLLSRPFHPKN